MARQTNKPGSKSVPPKTPRKRGAPKKLELIEYPPDEPMVDHRGRVKPMYKRRTAAPTWKPSRFTRLLLGLFPGARMMALVNVKRGTPYAAAGLIALVAAVMLATSVTRTSDTLGWLMIDARWLLIQAIAIVLVVGSFEFLRLASALEERAGVPKGPRIVGAMFLPSVMVLFGAPDFLSAWPRLVEAAWFASLILTAGTLPGVIWCVFDRTLTNVKRRNRFRLVGCLVVVLLVAVLVVTGALDGDTRHILASISAVAGFKVLPSLLG